MKKDKNEFKVLRLSEYNPASTLTEVSTLHFDTAAERDLMLREWFESCAFDDWTLIEVKEVMESLTQSNKWAGKNIDAQYSTIRVDLIDDDIVDLLELYNDSYKLSEKRSPKAKWVEYDFDGLIIDASIA